MADQLNALLSPFDLLSSDNFQSDSAENAAVVLSLSNSGLFALWGGYDVPPGAGATLTITDDGVVVWKAPITQDGPFQFVFRPGISAADGGPLVATLSDGGADVTGYLSSAAVLLAPITPTLVQQAVASDDSQTAVAVFDDPLTEGNSVIACISYPQGAADDVVVQLEDGLGAVQALTRAQRRVSGGGGVVSDIWYVHDVEAGLTQLSVDAGATNNCVNVNASEWASLNDVAPEATGTNDNESAAVFSNPVAPTGAALIIAMGAWPTDVYGSGPTADFTRMTPTGQALNDALYQEAAYLAQETGGSFSTSWELLSSQDWAAVIVAFQPGN